MIIENEDIKRVDLSCIIQLGHDLRGLDVPKPQIDAGGMRDVLCCPCRKLQVGFDLPSPQTDWLGCTLDKRGGWTRRREK